MTQRSQEAEPDFSWLDEAIVEQEEILTKELREATGNPELVAEFDRHQVWCASKSWFGEERRACDCGLLSPEKRRKWPEDFRGFGSNVRPKKSK